MSHGGVGKQDYVAVGLPLLGLLAAGCLVVAALAWVVWAFVGLTLHAAPPGPRRVLGPSGDVYVLTVAEVCSIRWGLDARHVTDTMKQQVLAARYPQLTLPKGCCVFDHIVPRELAGADVVANLQIQDKATARRKDREENRLHRLVCAHEATLEGAQAVIRRWRP